MSVIDRSMENLRRILSQSSSGRRVSSPKPDAQCAQFTSPSIVSSVSVENSADSEIRPGIKDQEVCTFYHDVHNMEIFCDNVKLLQLHILWFSGT